MSVINVAWSYGVGRLHAVDMATVVPVMAPYM